MHTSTDTASNWILEDKGFDPKAVVHHGNKYFLGNGYMGYRGTMEEFEAGELVGIMVAGLYDKVGNSWREPVNAPNPFFTRVIHNNTPLHLLHSPIENHQQSLHLRLACHSRSTTFTTPENNRVTLTARRFLSQANRHLLAMEYTIHCEQSAELTIETGIDTKIWDINGPHLHIENAAIDDDIIVARCKTQELGRRVAMAETVVWDNPSAQQETMAGGFLRSFRLQAKAGQTYRFWKFAALFTDNDGVASPENEAVQLCRQAREAGFAKVFEDHAAAWEKHWLEADVEIEGDPEGQFALRYSLYHLLSIAPEHSERLSIPARGLSAQVYKGAVFWDTEMFMVPFFLSTLPHIARNLILYRYHTLDGARRKAKEYGFEGAFFAWESQESGDDACSLFNITDVFTGRPMRTYFRDKQIHVSAAIAHAIQDYLQQTGDEAFLLEGGAEVIFECARFFQSYAYYKVSRERYEFLDVTGPDEYHERVHNNAYTNRMVRQTFGIALEVRDLLEKRHPEFFAALIERLSLKEMLDSLPELVAKTFVPGPAPETGIIPQFDGYETLEDVTLQTLKSRLLNPTEYLGGGNGLATSTRILKQADVVLMLSLFPEDYSKEIQQANWNYYEPRTEHGSSLSACAYARVAAQIREPDVAYPHFLKSATIDLTGKSKQYIGPLYIGGTHPASNGGAWMVAILGFAGLQINPEGPSLHPCLPRQWKSLRFRVHWHGQAFTVAIRRDETTIEADKTNDETCAWTVGNQRLSCPPGKVSVCKPEANA
jgi:trehalose/maltose hydrolase-like predicted phosphorylase